ncbi:MAG: hypothetical protein ABDI19_11605 [Armatimonadota bacterium]
MTIAVAVEGRIKFVPEVFAQHLQIVAVVEGIRRLHRNIKASVTIASGVLPLRAMLA